MNLERLQGTMKIYKKLYYRKTLGKLYHKRVLFIKTYMIFLATIKFVYSPYAKNYKSVLK